MPAKRSDAGPAMSNIGNLGPLQDPDENGLRLPVGFSSRIIARSNAAVQGSGYLWHNAPDGVGGGATPWGTWLPCEETPTGRV